MRVFLVGFGVVGRSLVALFRRREEALYADHGFRPRLVGVTDSRGAAISEHGLDLGELLAAKEASGSVAEVSGHGISRPDVEKLIDDSDADVVVEATPSHIADPSRAMGHIKAAFRGGRHVVTVNKGPLAVAMPALVELARYNQVELRYSGTVGGGTPVLAWARECARGDEILGVRGILNGTTNYILWRMTEEGATYGDALAEATELGYAETDPSADVDGIDAATKVVIFANLILGRPATMDDVSVTGIRDFPVERIGAAKEKGEVVKLIGRIGERLSVEPLAIPEGDPLNVSGSLNAVSVTLRHGGDITLIGRGAGGPETATSVLRDLLDIWSVMGSGGLRREGLGGI